MSENLGLLDSGEASRMEVSWIFMSSIGNQADLAQRGRLDGLMFDGAEKRTAEYDKVGLFDDFGWCTSSSPRRVFPINREDPTSRSSTPRLCPHVEKLIFVRGAETNTPITEINVSSYGPKATVALFAPLSDVIITGHESGKIAKYDVKTGEELQAVNESHFAEITDVQLSPDGTYFVTSSKDKSAKVCRFSGLLFLEPHG